MLKALFEVAVKSTGLGKAKGDLDAMGKSAQNVQKSHHAARDAAEAHYAVQAKGVIGTANSTKSFSKLASTMGEGGGIVGAYATLAANVFAVTAAFNALKGAAQVEQITRGLEVLGNRSGQTLGIVAKDLRDITNGAISTEQALRSTAQITSAGFKSDNVLAIGKLASDVSLALGRDMTDSIDRLTRGIIKLEPELLDELGLMTRLGEASAAYALQLGKPVSALTTLEKRQGFMNAIMAEGQMKFGGVSDAAGNLKNYDKLAATFADLTKSVFGFINSIGGLNIAGFFADNLAVLGGAAVLFLSTLKSQLLPGILSITATAKKAADEARESAVTEQKDILGAHKKLGSNPEFLNEIIKVGPENASNAVYTRAIEAGNVATAQEKKNLDAATAALDKHTASKKASVAQTKTLTAEVNRLSESYQNHKDAVVEVQQSQIATLKAATATAAQNAVTAGSQVNIMAAVRGVAASYTAYRTELIVTTGATTRLALATATLRAGLHATKIAAMAAGAALLSAMGWIGIAFAAVGGLIAAIKSFESAEKKLENKKAKELSEIYGQLGDKLKELEKINESNASAYTVTISGLTLEANAVSELAAKYQELQDAKNARATAVASGQDSNSTSTARWWDAPLDLAMGGITGTGVGKAAISAQSNRTGLARNSQALFMSNDPGTAQGLGSIENLDPERFAQIREGFESLDEVAKSQLVNKTLQEMAAEAAAVAEVMSQFPATNKAAADSFANLVKNAIPTSAFDAPLTTLTAFISQYERLINLEGATESQKLALIGGIEAGLASQLSLKAQIYIQDAQTVSNLEQLIRNGVVLNTTQQTALDTAKESLAVSEVGQEGLKKELDLLREKTALAQQEIAILKSRNTLISAQINEQKTANSFTLAGLQKEMDMQNELVANEIRMLEIEKSKLEAQSVSNAASIARLNSDLVLFDLETQRLEVQRALTKEAQDQEILSLRMHSREKQSLASRTGLEEDQRNANDIRAYSMAYEESITKLREEQKTLVADETAGRARGRAAIKASIDAKVEENRVVLLGINALDTQISAASLKGLSAIEQANKLARLASVINRRREDQENAIAASYRTQLELRRKNIALITGQSNVERDFAEIQFAAAERLRETTATFAREREDNTLARREGADTTDAAVRAANEAHWDIEDGMLDRRERAALDLIDYQTFSNQLQAVYFDSQVKGVEIQQNVLSMLEKQASVRADMNASSQTLAQAEERLSRRRGGYGPETREGTRASEINAALESLKIADREYNLKLLQIEMEYDLLEARTKLLREETRAHLANARATNRDGVLDTQIAQLENVEAAFGQILDNSAQTRASAIITARNIRDTAERNLGIARMPEGTRNPTGYDRNRLRTAEAQAQQYLTNRIETQTIAYVEGTAATRELTQAITDYSRAPIFAQVNSENATESTTSTLVRNARQEALALGREINSRRGMRADEHPELGGVTPVHARGSLHNSGRALDINYSGPGEKAKLDQLAAELRARYGDSVRILWQTTGHWTHLHIEFLRDTYTSMVNSMETAVGVAQERATQAIAEVETPTGLVQTLTNSGNAYGRDLTARVETAVPAAIPAPMGIAEALQDLPGHLSPLMAMFEELGPEGQSVIKAIAGISLVGDKLAEVTRLMAEEPKNKAGIFSAMADTAVAGLGVLRSALEATSQAKISSIDREIAAEQKRDGKSADSVAKIAALEKKKEATAKKAFEVNKKLQIAQAVISTASAVMQTYANSGGAPWAIPLAAMVAAVGAAQIAMIAGTSYQGGGAASTAVATPSTLSIGKRGDSVDLARNNANAGGEIGYLRGARGRGSNASNYSVIGSAYGGAMPRGYGNTAFVVGEHGPETITPETPITVRPMNDNSESQRALPPVNINIQALDAKGVEEILYGQRGNIIGMLREAANNSGQTFLENVNTAVYNKPNVGRL